MEDEQPEPETARPGSLDDSRAQSRAARLLRVGAIAAGALCILLPLSVRVFLYPLYHEDYLRAHAAGRWQSGEWTADNWMVYVYASAGAGLLLGLAGLLAAILSSSANGRSAAKPSAATSNSGCLLLTISALALFVGFLVSGMTWLAFSIRGL